MLEATHRERGRNTMKKTKSELNFLSHRENKPVDILLYEDAKHRWDKQEVKRKELERLKDEKIQSTKPPTGNKNSMYAA